VPFVFQPRFSDIAEEFDRYRPGYPEELFKHILKTLPVRNPERAMDLGAGTGKSTRALVGHFREVIAVEPDPGMAAKLREEIPEAKILKVAAEECVLPEASVDLVTIGNALHWMDFERVFANVHRWLRAAGIFAVYDRPLPKTTPAIDEVILRELRGPWKPHRDPRLKRDLVWESEVHKAPGFQVLEEIKFSYVIPMLPAQFTGFWRSTSYGGAYARTLANPEAYWNDLESRIAFASAGAAIPVDLSPSLIVARKI